MAEGRREWTEADYEKAAEAIWRAAGFGDIPGERVFAERPEWARRNHLSKARAALDSVREVGVSPEEERQWGAVIPPKDVARAREYVRDKGWVEGRTEAELAAYERGLEDGMLSGRRAGVGHKSIDPTSVYLLIFCGADETEIYGAYWRREDAEAAIEEDRSRAAGGQSGAYLAQVKEVELRGGPEPPCGAEADKDEWKYRPEILDPDSLPRFGKQLDLSVEEIEALECSLAGTGWAGGSYETHYPLITSARAKLRACLGQQNDA